MTNPVTRSRLSPEAPDRNTMLDEAAKHRSAHCTPVSAVRSSSSNWDCVIICRATARDSLTSAPCPSTAHEALRSHIWYQSGSGLPAPNHRNQPPPTRALSAVPIVARAVPIATVLVVADSTLPSMSIAFEISSGVGKPAALGSGRSSRCVIPARRYSRRLMRSLALTPAVAAWASLVSKISI
jgi:hypothetical protein